MNSMLYAPMLFPYRFSAEVWRWYFKTLAEMGIPAHPAFVHVVNEGLRQSNLAGQYVPLALGHQEHPNHHEHVHHPGRR